MAPRLRVAQTHASALASRAAAATRCGRRHGRPHLAAALINSRRPLERRGTCGAVARKGRRDVAC